jgi:hypothetical protein
VDYYILGGQERLNELVKLAMSLQPSVVADGDAGLDADSIYRNIRGVFDKLNSDDPHYRYGFAMLNGPIDYTASPPSAVMSEFRGPADDNGPILRIDVYPRYRQALEDRPITTQVTFRVPHSEAEVRDSVERFNIFGEDISMPSEFASVTIDDPLSGRIENQPMSVRILTPEPTERRRVRYIVSEPDGERVASAIFTVTKLTRGLSGGGFAATLTSDSQLMLLTQHAGPRDDHDLAGKFNLTVRWQDKVAAAVIDEIKFARELHRPRKMVLAQEFTGPFMDVASLDDIDSPPIPEWVERYARALADLQEYANVPLRLIAPADDNPGPIIHAIRIASILHGAIIGSRSPMMSLQLEGADLQEVVAHVEATGELKLDTSFTSHVADGHVNIPGARYTFKDVTARIGVVNGEEQLILAPAGESTDVGIAVCLARFLDDGE